MRRPLAVVTLALCTAGELALGACTVMNGLHVPPAEAGTPPAPDASDAADPCARAVPPPNPPTFTDGDGGGVAFLFTLRSIRVSADDGGPPIGYDIDGVCTCISGPESCVSEKPHCDDPGGRDNAFADLASTLALRSFDVTKRINERTAAGTAGVLVRVDRYDGEADDSDVGISMYASGGTYAGDGGFEGPLEPDGGYDHTPPFFDTRDQWTVNRDELVSPTATDSSHRGTGYVRDHVLVATIDAYIEIVPGSRTIWRGARFSGRLVQGADGAWTMADGVIAGRWPTSQLIEVLGLFEDDTTRQNYCELQGWPEFARDLVCTRADVAINDALDRTGAPCDAVSIALAFVGAPASFGPPVQIYTGPPRCADAGKITCGDSGQ